MKNAMKAAMLAAVFGLTAVTSGQAIAKEELLGTAVFEARPQRDVVKVGAKEGRFKAIRMEVKNNDVEVLDLKVVYGNGAADDIQVRESFKAGSSSRVIDLVGHKRAIKEIVVTYVARKPAKILFFGVEGAAASSASWERLGCKQVGFHVDRDTLKVGRKDGSFAKIKMKVKSAPIEFFGARVVFGNGGKQDIKFNQIVKAGSESRPIDLKGDERGISQIVLLYRSIPTFKGKAEVCVDGLQR